MISKPDIINPKRYLDPEDVAERRFFPYYAGFSKAFVESTLNKLNLPNYAKVLDPWNGSGTTTTTVFNHGLTAIGSDLNPVMALVAKAPFVSRLDIESLTPLAYMVIENLDEPTAIIDDDPLNNWFHPKSVIIIRSIEERINRYFVSPNRYARLDSPETVSRVTPLASFFYLALFRIVRRQAHDFFASNPTWIRVAKCSSDKKRLSKNMLLSHFVDEVKLLCKHNERFPLYRDRDHERLQIMVSNAETIPLAENSIDAVITSPPYCTRIDYAVATYIELAILRIGGDQFSSLRRTLTGTSTVQREFLEINTKWGQECVRFLQAVYDHPSKASKSYYYKSHLEYFNSLYKSLSDVSRVLSRKAPCVLVVQNSYYKNIRTNVADIVKEMAQNLNMPLVQQADFLASRSMAELNVRSRKYVGTRSTIESVLFLEKQ